VSTIAEDLALVRPLAGFFVGLLTAEELAAFYRLVHLGLAFNSYQGTAGWLGLAKVALA
jgi:hypothetical protein